jgi:hypothetical protein
MRCTCFVAEGDQLLTQDLGSKGFVSDDIFALGDRIPEVDVHGVTSTYSLTAFVNRIR